MVREDTDGDGLSDSWEKINGRDPADGKLLFTFDCGGWQTEGWTASQVEAGNIAGRQGFLDFHLAGGKVELVRSKLKLNAKKNQGKLQIRLRAATDLEISFAASGEDGRMQSSAAVAMSSDKEYQTAQLDLPQSWEGTVEQIQISLVGKPDALVEVDWIRIP